MRCKICGTDSHFCFSGKILGKYDISYYHCSHCDFVQTERPYWLAEAYSRPINLLDTGYIQRNLFYSKRLTILLYLMFGKNGRFLDYGGGYGVFVRLMRDIGFDFCWDDKHTKNLFAAGLEWDRKTRVDAVTLFEVFEHFVDPIKEIENLLEISDTIIFSTELHPNPLPRAENWWYYGLDHGQHVAFYSKVTFDYIADKYALSYHNLGSLHILTRKKVSTLSLFATKFSNLGLDRLIAKLLESKTWSDYELLQKRGMDENSL
jgi:hypothetical protein